MRSKPSTVSRTTWRFERGDILAVDDPRVLRIRETTFGEYDYTIVWTFDLVGGRTGEAVYFLGAPPNPEWRGVRVVDDAGSY